MRAQKGFSLAELVIAIILISLLSIPVLGQFNQASEVILLDEERQTAAQLAQQEMEQFLAIRRILGYSNGALALNPGATTVYAPPYNQLQRFLVISNHSGSSGCPPASTCKKIAVEVQRVSDNAVRAQAELLLVNY